MAETTADLPKEMADTVTLVQSLLGGRAASKVHVEVTRGGTYRITAEAGDGTVRAKHDWRP